MLQIFAVDLETRVRHEIKDLYWFEEEGIHDFGGKGHCENYAFEVFVRGGMVFPPMASLPESAELAALRAELAEASEQLSTINDWMAQYAENPFWNGEYKTTAEAMIANCELLRAELERVREAVTKIDVLTKAAAQYLREDNANAIALIALAVTLASIRVVTGEILRPDGTTPAPEKDGTK